MNKQKQPKKRNFCHDCGCKIIFKGDEIRNGQLLVYPDGDKKIKVLKCNDCYNKPDGKELRNFREVECYSRIVGYMRPISQWNVGKKLEYKQRKTYDPSKTSRKKVQGVETPKKS